MLRTSGRIILASLLAQLVWVEPASGAKDEAGEEPAFPTMQGLNRLDSIHLASERAVHNEPVQQVNEFTDFAEGRSALVESDTSRTSVSYQDAATGFSYRYEPHRCSVEKTSGLELANYAGLWRASVTGGGQRTLWMFGLTALWLNAASLPKVYSASQIIYSPTKDGFRKAHRWSVDDAASKTTVHLYFVRPTRADDRTGFSLEMVEVKSSESGKLLQTWNVFSVRRYIYRSDRLKYLEVPLGFGCREPKSEPEPEPEEAGAGLQTLQGFQGPVLLDLEVSASKFTPAGLVSTSTVSVRLARSLGDGQVSHLDPLDLMQVRDTRQNHKRIYHNKYNVLYEIDLRSGACKMSPFSAGANKSFRIVFSNQLVFDERLGSLGALFSTKDYQFNLIRRVEKDVLYQEASFYADGQQTKLVRLVRVYKLTRNAPLSLDQVLLYVLSPDTKTIEAVYNFNLMKATALRGPAELAEVFDVSEECYINNPAMHQNRDYARLELSYAIPAVVSRAMAQRSNEIRTSIYDGFSFKGHLGFFRLPKLELMFEPSGLVLRALLLDQPRAHLRLRLERQDSRLAADSADSGRQLAEQLATDLEHCAELCRLSRACQSLSYCQHSHLCLISASGAAETLEQPYSAEEGCSVYTMPQPDAAGLNLDELSLQKLLGLLQSDSYQPVVLPEMPGELLELPGSFDSLSEEEEESLEREYELQVERLLSNQSFPLSLLTITAHLDRYTFVYTPSRLKVERDPLRQVEDSVWISGPTDSESAAWDQERAPEFHRGLVMRRYKRSAVAKQTSGQLFVGLSYEQCAYACTDAGCGSFSYCAHNRECILTNYYNLTDATVAEHIQEDQECFVAQRDFLSKFIKFSNVIKSDFHLEQAVAVNAAECAHSCFAKTNFQCLAFEFCSATREASSSSDSASSGGPENLCFFMSDRQLVASARLGAGQLGPEREHTCDHYARSYVADFVRMEHRQVREAELERMRTRRLQALSVDECAGICVTRELGCGAFQFCADPETVDELGLPARTCTLLESRPAAESPPTTMEPGSGNRSLLEASESCHVFALSRDNGLAQMRDLNLAALLSGQSEPARPAQSGRLSVGAASLMYLVLALASGSLAFAFVFYQHRSEMFRYRVQRLRLLLHLPV